MQQLSCCPAKVINNSLKASAQVCNGEAELSVSHLSYCPSTLDHALPLSSRLEATSPWKIMEKIEKP